MKKAKVYLSVLTVLIVLISTMTVGVFADSSRMGVSVSNSAAQKGDTVTVTVKVNSNPGIAGLDFVLNYDTSDLQYVSSSVGTVGNSFTLNGCNNTAGGVRGAFLNVDGKETGSTGTVATVKFKVISDKAKTSSVSLSSNFSTSNADNLNNTTVTSSVKLNSAVTTHPTTTKQNTTKATTTKQNTTKQNTTKRTTTEKASTTHNGETTTHIYKTETIAIKKGNSYQLAKPSSMSGKIEFSSSNSSVASISSSGVVTTYKKGMTTVKAVSENGVTKTWLLLVGDGSTVETTTALDETTTDETTVPEEETVTEDVTEFFEDETEAVTERENDKGNDLDMKMIIIIGTAIVTIIVAAIIVIKIRNKNYKDFIN